MKAENDMKLLPVSVIMWTAFILNGSFFDYSVAFIGALIAICLFIMLIRGEAFFKRDRRIVFLIPILILCMAVLVSLWSIDYMENFMGVMRLGVVCLWLWLIRCRKQEEIRFAKNSIPILGCCMVLISLFSFCIPFLKPNFWENSRMSGFFQYANTSGLFLAIGIILLIHTWKEQKRIVVKLVQLLLLLAGLLLTGSRSILLLLILWGVWYAVKTAAFRKPFLIALVLVSLLGILFVAFTGNTQNIGRIFTVFQSNSTLWGRLLYDRDALLLLAKKFYGLGRMGYYYSQGTFQSGVYHIKFVHNDFLQIALDYGVLALCMLLSFIGWQILRGKQCRRDKEIILFICAASLMDFHCQYLSILMVAALFLDYGECIREKKVQLCENYIFLPILCLIFVYVGIATGFSKAGNQDAALSMLPHYTYAQEKKIVSCMGTQEAYELAADLIRKSSYNITAYIARGSFYASQLQVQECIEDLDRMLELDPYNMEYYRQYEELLKNMQAQLNVISELSENQSGAEQYMALLQDRIESLPGQLAEMRSRTSSLAYKIKDKPIFSY